MKPNLPCARFRPARHLRAAAAAGLLGLPLAAAASGAGFAQASNRDTLYLDLKDGRVVIRMRPDLAPKHVERIEKLAKEHFYDGIVFHRVIDGFMAQTGCPHGTGTGGSKYPNLKQEFNAAPHVRGVCSMARSSNPDSANSQFFICFADARFLDRQYTVWGEVISGMENVDKIKRGEPVQNPDKIVSAKMS
jgi:peptidylprolyl isomerase